MSAPIEVTTKYVTSVDTLADAWSFVMDHIDRVGPDPTVHISPCWIMSVADAMDERESPPRIFEVVVEGMVSEGGDQS